MNAATFANELSVQIATLGRTTSSEITIDELVVKGRIQIARDLFLAVYYNEQKGTTAFALIEQEQRVWGIDYDKAMKWHRHPLRDTEKHEPIAPQTIPEIIVELKQVLEQLEK